MTTLYGIFFAIVIIALIMMLLLSQKSVETVKAGKVSDFAYKSHFVSKDRLNFPSISSEDDREATTSPLIRYLYVHGDSMKRYHIFDGDVLAVQPFTEEEKNTIDTFPVVVFHIEDASPLDSKYKLRKFWTYIDDVSATDWSALYDKFEPYMKSVSKQQFVNQCQQKAAKCIKLGREKERYILSETYDCHKNIEDYSLHRCSNLYGKAMYKQ